MAVKELIDTIESENRNNLNKETSEYIVNLSTKF